MLLKRLYPLLLTMMLILTVSSAHAEIFRWVDSNGMTHYSDQAPQSGSTTVIHRPSQPRRAVAHHGATSNGRIHRPGKPRVKTVRQQTLRKPARKAQPKQARHSVKKAKPARPANPRVQKQRTAQTRQLKKPARVPQARKLKKPVRKTQAKRVVKQQRAVERKRVKKQAQVTQRRKQTETDKAKKSRRIAMITHAATLQASLNETFYDIEMKAKEVPEVTESAEVLEVPEVLEFEPQQPEPKVITNVKESLCRDNRLLLASLQEKGFESYYDRQGEHRKAWGIEGFYRQSRRYLTSDEVAKQTKAALFEVEQYCDKPHDLERQAEARADWIRSEYCQVSKVILEDLKHPFMRVSDKDIQDQEKEVERFCSVRISAKDRQDERYYPKFLQVKKLQQKHFLYR